MIEVTQRVRPSLTPGGARAWCLALVLGLAGVGCLKSALPVTPQSTLLSLQAQALLQGATTPQRVQSGVALRKGDQLGLVVHAEKPAYIYLLRTCGERPAQILYPAQGQTQAQPGQPLFIPGADGGAPAYFVVQGDEGGCGKDTEVLRREDLVLIASVRALPREQLPTLLSRSGREEVKVSFPGGREEVKVSFPGGREEVKVSFPGGRGGAESGAAERKATLAQDGAVATDWVYYLDTRGRSDGPH